MVDKAKLGELNFSEQVSLKILSFLENFDKKLDTLISLQKGESIDGILEFYEVTAITENRTLWAPMDRTTQKRERWLWAEIRNNSATDVLIGVNGWSAGGIPVKNGETYKIEFANKRRISFIDYRTTTGTADIRITCAR